MIHKHSWSLVIPVALLLFTRAGVAEDDARSIEARLLAQAEPAVEVLDENMGMGDAPAVEPAAVPAAELTPTPAAMTEEETVPSLPMPEVETKKPMDPALEEVMQQEEVRRLAEEEHGKQSLEAAERAMKDRDYLFAIRMYDEAQKYIGTRPETAEQRKRITVGYPESLYRWALVLFKRNDLEKAKQFAHQAVGLGHPKALKLVEEIQDEINKPPPPPPPPQPRWKQDEFRKSMTEVESILNEGRQYYVTGEFERARDSFERVLKRDPENTEAIRWLEKTAQKRYDRATMELEATRRDMMTELRRTWNPRDYAVNERPDEEVKVPKGERREYQHEIDRRKLMEKMEKIKIPEIDFRQANIYDVISFLSQASIENDREAGPDEKKGVDIILNLGGAGGAAAGPSTGAEPADPFATVDVGGGGGGGGAGEIPLITFHARYVSLREALRIVTSVAGLKWSIRESVVMVVPLNAPDEDIIVRMYDVVPGVEERITGIAAEVTSGRNEGATTDFIPIGSTSLAKSERGDWQDFFEKMGVKWPQGSSIRYVQSIAKLIVANTPENLSTFEQVLEALNVVPSQIEIEARFVEVQQTDLDALGFEWLLSDDWELLQRKSQGNVPLANKQRVSIMRNDTLGGFTRANRFAADVDENLASNNFVDDVLRIGGVLTNPELTMVLHAINQMGNTDLLSAPKVTTQSGAEATIKVVTEYIYPTEFTVEPIIGYTGGNVSGSSQPIGAVVEPGGFETREVGVILTVLPEVSAEGQMITLTLAPEVVSDPTWRNYGSTYQTYAVDQATANQNVTDNTLPMEQPFFHTRSVTTTINIYNNATVMMGGMITENRTDVDDKIPFFGDIPIVGRLFRSRYEKSEKRNLLIFVTARLVDPAGRPVGKSKTIQQLEQKIAGASSGESAGGQ